MNISTSECSSGCESGWTMYLEQSSNSQDNPIFHHKNKDILGNCDENEDLSMVSDASSGPPHFEEDDEYCFDGNKRKKKDETTKEKKSGKKEQYLYLDDTASSPIKNRSSIPLTRAPVKHARHYEGKFAFHKNIGYTYMRSSMEKNQVQEQQVVCKKESENED